LTTPEEKPMLNLYKLLENCLERTPENLAVIFGEHRVSYRRLIEASERLAGGLAMLGIGRGDRVALMLPNVPQFPISFFAILKLGAAVVPVNVMFKEAEVRYILEDSEAKAIIAWGSFEKEVLKAVEGLQTCSRVIFLAEKVPPGTVNFTRLLLQSPSLKETVATGENDTALILYTAGVTGRPKGAELTHTNTYSNATSCRQLLQVVSEDRVLGALPLFHAFATTLVMNTAFAAGATVVLLPRFDPQAFIEAVALEKVTIIPGVPTLFRAVLDAAVPTVDFSSVRLCLSGGAPLPKELLEEFEERFGLAIFEGYGLSEASPVVSFNPIDHSRKPGSIGIPIPGLAMRIVDEEGHEVRPNQVGEIVVQGPNVMKGYLNRPEATKEVLRNGWLHTGDLGRMDEEGYFYIVDRKKDVIIKGGFAVYPREVEEVLHGHPQVEEAAVIGVPDTVQGEEVKAFVVLKPDSSVRPGELIAYCKERMAVYKTPKYVQFLPSLPKSATGKVLKTKLRD